jgi:hypothetical protein
MRAGLSAAEAERPLSIKIPVPAAWKKIDYQIL